MLWISIGYNVLYYAIILLTPWSIDRFGRRAVFSTGHVAFALITFHSAGTSSLHGETSRSKVTDILSEVLGWRAKSCDLLAATPLMQIVCGVEACVIPKLHTNLKCEHYERFTTVAGALKAVTSGRH